MQGSIKSHEHGSINSDQALAILSSVGNVDMIRIDSHQAWQMSCVTGMIKSQGLLHIIALLFWKHNGWLI